ncbi:MAG: c-type cytochrome, partial [bacterium]
MSLCPPVEQTSKARFFFVVSMMLVASIAWVVWDEIGGQPPQWAPGWVPQGRRPWKNYQQAFNRLEEKKVRGMLDAETRKVSEELAKLDTAIQKARGDLATSDAYAAAKERLADVQKRLEKVELENRFARSEQDEAYYEFRHAVESGGAAVAEKVRYDRLAALTTRLGKEESGLMGQEKASRQEKEKLERTLSDLEEKKSKLGGKAAALQRRLTAIQSRVPAIHQVVLEGIEVNPFDQPVLTVDRCQNCHLGIDRRGFEEFPAPFNTHPKRSVLLGKHPVERFGCTLCHGGQGQAINSLTKAHGIDLETGEHLQFWEAPLLRGDSIQTNCLKCHAQTLDIPMAPVVSKGKRLFIELGCHGCHLMKGFESLPKVGPSLLKAAQKLRPEWMVPWILEPRNYLPKTRMPFFSLTPEQATALTAYLVKASEKAPASGPLKYNPGSDTQAAAQRGKKLFERRGCLACHAIDGKGGEFGPDLSRVGAKV